jgi:hypothetical protein
MPRPPVGSIPGEPPEWPDVRFFVGLADSAFRSSSAALSGPILFNRLTSLGPPPAAIRDPISGEYRVYRVYYRGEIRSASSVEAAQLEPAAVWDIPQLIDRIAATSGVP